ncbi:MAG: DNA polymerase III subunit gamma/tau [Candidatus Eremiobacteraeota bacterium]|nr:DNA polymerase III subunit gamma/tau [Candidatus Eremiobacteraeota bacterium]
MAEEHMALYRRWRSQRFSEVIGQEHVVKTLQNVVRNKKLLAHAYLFCGPKGTGKTSVARIFAKALNCLEGPSDEPCNRCANCLKITEGNSLDVMEIDAASHTSVEMVREHIIDKVNFAPIEGKFKIYLIDEVHKLSNHSFNALLKTLEEPPSHVIFILATTHPHELLPTILSRCQRFDFRRISQQDIMRRLRMVCQEEGYAIEEGALGIIAQASDGALRDALVVLEQSFSFSEGEVTTAQVASLLGLTEESLLFTFSQLIGEAKVSAVLQLLDKLVRDGKDMLQFVHELIEHYRRLLIVKVSKEAPLILEIAEDGYERLQKNAGIYEPGDILRIIKILSDLMVEMKDATCERVLLEVALIKMSTKRLDPSLSALKQRLDSLEKRIFDEKGELKEKASPPEVKQEVSPAAEAPKEAPPPPEEKKDSHEGHGGGLWEHWPRILQAVKNEKMPLYAVLVDTKPRLAEGDRVIIGVKKGFNFHKEQVETHRALIGSIISKFLHRPISVEAGGIEGEDGQGELFNDDYAEEHRKFVKDVMDVFGGRII